MTPEQLMNPRYEVIADYPFSKIDVGTILHKHNFDENVFCWVSNPESPLQGSNMSNEWVEKCPHIFRRLQWWEKRDLKDLPEYVKCIQKCQCYEPIYFKDKYYRFDEIKDKNCLSHWFTPATESEYFNSKENGQ